MTALARSFAIVSLAALAAIASGSATFAEDNPALVQAGQGSAAIAQGQFDRAIELLTAALTATDLAKEQKANILNDRGIAYWRRGDLKLAVDDFNAAVTLFPEFAAVYNNRGNVLLALNQSNEAIKDFDRAVLLAPGYVAAYNNRAIAHMQLGQYDAAIVDFSTAAEIQPTSSAPFNGRGRAQLALGRPYAAMRDFSRAIAVDPSYRPGYRNRAQARIVLSKYDEAVEDLSNALEASPDDPQLLLGRGEANMRGKHYGDALRDYDKVATLDPNSAAAVEGRGYALAKIDEFDKALADFAKALELDHRNAAAYIHRAWTEGQMKAPELGLADIERALKLNPQAAEAFRVRGDLYEKLGRQDASIADYRKAVSLDGNDEEAWAAIQRLTGEGRPAPAEVAGAEFEDWKVLLTDDGHYLGENSTIDGLSVPLEMFGSDAPRILDWEVKTGLYKGIGVLRYKAGTLPGKAGREDVELAAVIDIRRRSVISLEPYRQGARQAVWNWDEAGQLAVKGPDGITSQIALKSAPPASSGATGSSYAQSQQGGGQTRVYSPFDIFFGGGNSQTYTRQKDQTNRQATVRRRKPKTIFDLLFQ